MRAFLEHTNYHQSYTRFRRDDRLRLYRSAQRYFFLEQLEVFEPEEYVYPGRLGVLVLEACREADLGRGTACRPKPKRASQSRNSRFHAR